MKAADARTLPPAAQEDQRLKAILALQSGKSKAEVARLFGVSCEAVYQWIERYEQDGAAGLAARKRGKPAERVLPASQAARLSQAPSWCGARPSLSGRVR